MKINLWGINYHPEPTGIAVYSTQICQYLVEQGHNLSVTTGFPYYPSWKIEARDRQLVRTEVIDNVNVYRNWLYVPTRLTFSQRVIHELSFVLTSTIRQLVLPAPDLYFVVSPPLLLGMAAWIVGMIKARPFVFHIQDLQPDAGITLGIVKQKWLVSFLLWIEAFTYQKAKCISVISDHMRQTLIAKGVPAHKIFVSPNAICISKQSSLPGTWRKSRGIPDSVPVVSYCGNLGLKQGLESVLDAAALLLGEHPVQFVICGDGAVKGQLRDTIEKNKLTNVLLLDVLATEEYGALLADSALCLVTLRPGTGAAFLPSKLLNILAAGRPVVTNADPGSALHDAVIDGKFGITCAEGGHALAEAIAQGLNDVQKLEQMSAAGKQYVEQFDEQKVLSNLHNLLLTLLGKTSLVV
jgi:colanic acid biosynthesis glycosyl transferase WcaI